MIFRGWTLLPCLVVLRRRRFRTTKDTQDDLPPEGDPTANMGTYEMQLNDQKKIFRCTLLTIYSLMPCDTWRQQEAYQPSRFQYPDNIIKIGSCETKRQLSYLLIIINIVPLDSNLQPFPSWPSLSRAGPFLVRTFFEQYATWHSRGQQYTVIQCAGSTT